MEIKNMGFLCLVISLILISSARVSGERHVVGDQDGWTPSVNYTRWSEKYRFFTGDWLIFSYERNQNSVLQVGRAEFNSCNSENIIKNWTDGSGQDFVHLDSPGFWFFITGEEGNCFSGMKLAIEVLNHTAPPPPVSSADLWISNWMIVSLCLSLSWIVSIREEDMRWFMETPENDSINMGNDLHTIGGLGPLIEHLKRSSAGIRAKAAEVVMTIVENNPKGHQLVMEANGLGPLLSNLTSDPDVAARTQALSAISSLIRDNKPGLAAFRLANGYETLRDALSSDNVKYQREALSLVQYLLQENSSDCNVITELGFPRTMMHLVSITDCNVDVREVAPRGLLELAKDEQSETSSSSVASTDNEKLKQILKDRVTAIGALRGLLEIAVIYSIITC